MERDGRAATARGISARDRARSLAAAAHGRPRHHEVGHERGRGAGHGGPCREHGDGAPVQPRRSQRVVTKLVQGKRNECGNHADRDASERDEEAGAGAPDHLRRRGAVVMTIQLGAKAQARQDEAESGDGQPRPRARDQRRSGCAACNLCRARRARHGPPGRAPPWWPTVFGPPHAPRISAPSSPPAPRRDPGLTRRATAAIWLGPPPQADA